MGIRVTDYTVANTKIPKELSGYRIALLSDLHNCEFGRRNSVLLDMLRDEMPDLVLIPGDAIQRSSREKNKGCGCDNIIPFFEELARICPIIYSNGNHEARFCSANAGGGLYEEYNIRVKSIGITVLNNKSLYIRNKQVRFIGLDLPLDCFKRGNDRLDVKTLESYIGTADRGIYNILLAHNPRFFKTYIDWGADLIVSGHIHGGIIRIPVIGGLLSPYRTLFPGFDYGEYLEDGKTMIVSGGIGRSAIPFRINNDPEIVMITLYKKAED